MRQTFKAGFVFALTCALTAPCLIPGNVSSMAFAQAAQYLQFVDSGSGLTFAYPRGWGVTKGPEKDCIVKIEGAINGGYGGEIKLNVSADNVAPATLASIAETTFFKSLPAYRKAADGASRIGRLGQFPAHFSDISFRMGDVPIRQQYYFFSHNDKTYTVMLTAPQAGFAPLQPTFKRMLESISVDRTRHAAVPNTASARQMQKWKLIPMESSPVAARLWYPEGWRLSPEGGGDERGFKIVGANAQGHGAELHLWSGPRGEMSLEQFVDLVEQEHLKPLPQYRRLSMAPKTFGSPPIDGVNQFATYVADGMPGKQSAFFFVDRDKFYCLALMTVAWSQDEMRDLFDRVASSVKFQQ